MRLRGIFKGLYFLPDPSRWTVPLKLKVQRRPFLDAPTILVGVDTSAIDSLKCCSRRLCLAYLLPRQGSLHCKKGYRFSRPQAGCHWQNSPWPGIIKFFPARESLASDIPAGDGKIDKLILQCISCANWGGSLSKILKVIQKRFVDVYWMSCSSCLISPSISKSSSASSRSTIFTVRRRRCLNI